MKRKPGRRFISNIKESLINSEIYNVYYNRPVRDDLVFVESRNGKDFAGNILRLAVRIRELYGDRYTICTAAVPDRMDHIRQLLSSCGLDDVQIYEYDSRKHIQMLETAGYLINDTTFPFRYVKRDGQICLNTWHGTPYKKMGNDKHEGRHLIDNIQRNLMQADYLLFPSRYCEEKMTSAHCIEDMYQGAVLEEGYPRNSVFFDPDAAARVKETYGLGEKQVYVYMPTFREKSSAEREDRPAADLSQIVKEIDEQLTDGEIMFVKLHPLEMTKLDLGSFRHIRRFPEDIEPYEFLTACNCLVTDYSSVFYDFANSRRKIVRFIYDEDDYSASRGLYDQPVEIPFPAVSTVSGLISELRSGIDYDDRAFLECYCTYDNADAADRIIRHIFEKADTCREHRIYAERKRVLVYSGDLAEQPLTEFLESLNNEPDDNTDYYICFSRVALRKKSNIGNLRNLPVGRPVYGINGRLFLTLSEYMAKRSERHGSGGPSVSRKKERYLSREFRRSFLNTDFSKFIYLSGDNSEITEVVKCSGAEIVSR